MFFPDPWPKKRHHKRRLLKPEFVRELALRLAPQGYLRVATDWETYAQEILETLSAEPLLVNTADGFAPRPRYRPLTKFEARGTRARSPRLGSPLPAAVMSAVHGAESGTRGASLHYHRRERAAARTAASADLAASTLRAGTTCCTSGSGTVVVEDVARRSIHAARELLGGADVDVDALRRWLELSGIGILHTCTASTKRCRGASRCAAAGARALPYVVTLHDLQFVNPRAFDAKGCRSRMPTGSSRSSPTLERAATVIAPSAFILDVALACSAGIQATADRAPGVRTARHGRDSRRTARISRRCAPKHVVAIVGAVGPHKGSGVLRCARGRSRRQRHRYRRHRIHRHAGHARLARSRASCTCHGAYDDGTLAALARRHTASETVLFPNRLPESFSYTLLRRSGRRACR